MVLPVSDIELFVPTPLLSDSRSKQTLYILFWFLLVLAFAHLSYGDFWGFLLDVLFSFLGYVTFKRMQLSTMAFFAFLCAFNAGVDLMASIGLLSQFASSTKDQLDILAQTLRMQPWQLVLAAVVITLEAIVFSMCLVLTCRLYSELRAVLYSQLGLLGMPLTGGNQQTQSLIMQHPGEPAGSQQGSFQAFQGRARRVNEAQEVESAVPPIA